MTTASAKRYIYLALFAIIVNLIAVILLDFVILPAVLPYDLSQEHASTIRHISSLAFFLVGLVASGCLIYLAISITGGNNVFQDVFDSIPRPLLAIDENRRYILINTEAERALGLSRNTDLGKTLDRELEVRTFAADSGLAEHSCFIKGDRAYIASEHLLPQSVNPSGRRWIIILDDVNDLMRLRKSVYNLEHDLAIIGADTDRIAGASQSLFDGATKQAGYLSAISSSLDEFSRKIQGNTEAASKGTQLAAQAREAAERSGSEIANALSAMTDVQDAGVRIVRIVKLIDDIAFQTNLLALNAAVEAARAGRQGKGFAVVADEVRNLAGRSAKAAKDTAAMVEDVTERIGNASAYISRLEDMLRNIMQDAVRMADSSAVASEVSLEQASAILQVNRELAEMNDLTQITKSEAERTVSSVQDLARLIDDLKVRFTKLDISADPALPYTKQQNRISDRMQAQATESKWSEMLENAFKDEEVPDIMGQKSFAQRAEESIPLGDYGVDPHKYSHHHGSTLPQDGGEIDYDDEDAPFKRMALLRELQESAAQKHRSEFAGSPTEYSTTADGDKVVKPNQNIQLDDTDFGRY